MKKLAVAALIIVVAAAVVIVVVGRTFFPDNIAQTSEGGGTKGLKTRVYRSDAEAVKKASKEVIAGLTSWGSAWKLTDETDGGSELRLKAEVPVVVFTDDLEVTIKGNDDGTVEVNVRSESRVGKSDFGENARHVRKLLSALDQKMKR